MTVRSATVRVRTGAVRLVRGATVHVRDSKDVDGGRLAFPDGVWSTFVGFAGRSAVQDPAAGGRSP
ncbi:DUF397 domain-containing protein [Streptomyces populi]